MFKSFPAALAFIALISLTSGFAQAQKTEAGPSPQKQKTQTEPSSKASQQPAEEPKKPAAIPNPTARLASAKNVFIVRAHGSNIPFDTIRTTIDNWERFTMVSSADKADLIIEVASEGGDNDVRVTSKMGPAYQTGSMEESSSATRDLSSTEVSMTVSDAHNKRVLWRATQSAKYSMREKTRENNLVEAAEKLASKFHDRLEPPSMR